MKNQNLLGSWQWYFVKIESQGEQLKFILDESEYENFLQRLEKGERHIKVVEDYFFWSDIKRFGEVEFEWGVITILRGLPDDQQEHIKKLIRSGKDITTMDKLRSEISYFLSK